MRFETDFLRRVSTEFARRRKALRHRGTVEVEQNEEGDPPEWLRIILKRAAGPYVIVELRENQRCNVYVRSVRKHDRGKILLRLEAKPILNRARSIVGVIEKTLTDADYSTESLRSVRNHWRTVCLGVATPMDSVGE